MPLLIGLGLALAVGAFARLSGFDRDRAFYPVVLIVVGHYYVLFAIVAGGAGLGVELAGLALFAALALLGFRRSLWIAAGGLALHGVFDFLRPGLLEAHGAPAWWPYFCLGFDGGAGAVLAAILLLDRGDRWARARTTLTPP
jgi:hypothetical protein